MSWTVVLLEPIKTMLGQIGEFIMAILGVLAILAVGWVIARIVKRLVLKVLDIISLDKLCEQIKLGEILAKGGIKYSVSELIGVVSYWLVLLIALVIAINTVGLTAAADILNRIVLYIPNIIAAIFVLILGMFVATLLSSLVQAATANAGVVQSKLLGKIAEVITIIFTIAIVLEQLKIGAVIVERVLTILIGSLGLGLAIAIGLGCKDIIGDSVAAFIDKVKTKK